MMQPEERRELFEDLNAYVVERLAACNGLCEFVFTVFEIAVILEHAHPVQHKRWVMSIRKGHRSGHIKIRAPHLLPASAGEIIRRAEPGSCFTVGRIKVYIAEEGE